MIEWIEFDADNDYQEVVKIKSTYEDFVAYINGLGLGYEKMKLNKQETMYILESNIRIYTYNTKKVNRR